MIKINFRAIRFVMTITWTVASLLPGTVAGQDAPLAGWSLATSGPIQPAPPADPDPGARLSVGEQALVDALGAGFTLEDLEQMGEILTKNLDDAGRSVPGGPAAAGAAGITILDVDGAGEGDEGPADEEPAEEEATAAEPTLPLSIVGVDGAGGSDGPADSTSGDSGAAPSSPLEPVLPGAGAPPVGPAPGIDAPAAEPGNLEV